MRPSSPPPPRPWSLPLVVTGLVLVAAVGTVPSAPAQTPLPRAHAHNDYEHPRPLIDALEQGFCSVEADIHLVEDHLLVAHDREDVDPQRTLQALYLDPLRDRVGRHGGRVFPQGPPFTLLIDIKSAAEPTYLRLREILVDYRDMLTAFHADRTQTNAVTLILSGNRPRAVVASESVRWVAIDGRLPDLSLVPLPNPHLIPLVSDNWGNHFRWRGEGPFPEVEQARLREWIAAAHQQGRRLRFWGAPDRREMWQVLAEAGVDLVNTDRLADLAAYLGGSAVR